MVTWYKKSPELKKIEFKADLVYFSINYLTE